MIELGDFLEIRSNFNKNAIRKSVKNLDTKINRKLTIKMKEALTYLRYKIASYAPNSSGDLRSQILSLPISGVRIRGFKILMGKSGSMTVVLNLNRRKDQKILWVDRGTGVFGPNRRRIRPRNAPFLQFVIDGKVIRAKSVAGQRGQHFIRRGINSSKLIMKSIIGSAFK